jgi:sporulation protein YlmC with PRC-barrel domain
MKRSGRLHMGCDLLDQQIVDGTLRRCGRVDEVELEMRDGRLVVSALVTGPVAMASRLPALLAEAVLRISRRRSVRIPWSAVLEIPGDVLIEPPLEELGLVTFDELAAPVVRRIPGA